MRAAVGLILVSFVAVAASGQRRQTKPPPPPPVPPVHMEVWAERWNSSVPNALRTEFSVNGTVVETFNAEGHKSLAPLKQGWNTITAKTAPTGPSTAPDPNGLRFDIGPVQRDTAKNQNILRPIVWTFWTRDGWRVADGQVRHELGPDGGDVTLAVDLYYGDMARDRREVKDGDYILRGAPKNTTVMAPMTATAFVNGTGVSSFIMAAREVVITDLLTRGKNEIKLVSTRITNIIDADNDIELAVFGPAEFDLSTGKLSAPQLTKFGSRAGWKTDPKTRQLVNPTDPAAKATEQVIPFVLERDPKAR